MPDFCQLIGIKDASPLPWHQSGITFGGMMTTPELSLAILGLLATPGPTNTLMFLAGAERGASRAMRLIPAELAGYLLTVVPLAFVGAHVVDSLPAAKMVIAFLAGAWVAALAVRLWRVPNAGEAGARISARTVFTTTLLNPKALIFGLVLLPAPQGMAVNFANFAAQVVLVACLWIAAGAALAGRRGPESRALPFVRRAASVWMGVLSVVLVMRGIGA